MSPLWLLRMAQWLRHQPSRRQVLIGAVVLGAALAVVAVEKAGLWPDWARVERVRR